MSWDFRETVFDLLGGADTLHAESEIPQRPSKVLRASTSLNMFSPSNRGDWQTRPGMADVRATAMNANGVFTGMRHLGELADKMLFAISIAGTNHSLWEDDANPITETSGGTDFTIGQDNLVSSIIFTDGSAGMAIFMSRQRDLPQSINASGTRANFTIAGTGLTSLKPSFGEVFGQRALYGNVNRDGTVEDDFWYWSDVRDGNLITDYLTQRESVQTPEKDRIRALKRFGDVCLIGKLHNVFLSAVNIDPLKPFSQRELPAGRYKGPVSHQGVVEYDEHLWWMGQTNIHKMDRFGNMTDVADMVKPTMEGLDDSRREFTVAEVDAKNDLILFSVSNDGSSTHDRVIAVNAKTGEVYPNWSLSVNAMGQRLVGSEHRLLLGGYVGLFRNWDSSATGNADNAAAAIDGQIITPRHHLGVPGKKLFAGITVWFKPQASEAVTVQYRLDDASSFTSFSGSPYTVTGTAKDVNKKFFPLMKAGHYLQINFQDATTGEVYRIQQYSIHWKPITPGLIF